MILRFLFTLLTYVNKEKYHRIKNNLVDIIAGLNFFCENAYTIDEKIHTLVILIMGLSKFKISGKIYNNSKV